VEQRCVAPTWRTTNRPRALLRRFEAIAMPTHAIPQMQPAPNSASPERIGEHLRGFSALLVLCVPVTFLALVLASTNLAAQTSPAPAAQTPPVPSDAPPQKPAHVRKHSAANQPAPQPTPPPAPVQPPPPNWPANNLPAAASVVWNSHGLLVIASNSSLNQILKDVSTDTGAKVEGLDQDERVFGTYGPGPARDVLSQLLDGSGYNVLMVGDQGQGTPRRIVLSGRGGGEGQPTPNKSPSATADQDADADQQADQPAEQPQPEAQPQQPTQPPNGPAPGVPVRTPQQIIEEMQQRRLQQQQQLQQQNPQN
jgi:hypothetical protein